MDKSAVRRVGLAGFDPQGCGDFLRGRHPIKTAQAVAAATGDPARTVERWLAGTAAPTVGAFARLTRAFGPAFVAAAIPGLAWVEHAAALATHDGLSREIDTLQARRAAVARRLRLDAGRPA